MALIKCHECGTEVSTEARLCPKCGAKVKRPMSGGMIVLIGIATIAVLYVAVGNGTQTTNSADTRSAKERLAEIEAKYAATPHIAPPIDERPLDPKAQARAEKLTEAQFCPALGKALRGRDEEFTRAMILRSADLQLGVLHFKEQNIIKSRRIQLGITPCMAVAAWGRPDRINRSVGTYGVHEQWVYPANYLYFDDGILTSWQD